MTLPATLDVQVAVSWDGTAAFDGEHDDVTPDTAIDPGVQVRHGRQDSLTLSPPRISDGGFDVHNDDGTYSQERADSPIYQRVLPGRPVRYRAAVGTEGAYTEGTPYTEADPYTGLGTWPLGRHILREISQTTAIGNRRVAFETIGYETVLTRAVVTVPLQQAIRTDQAVTLLLDAAGWPEDARDVAVGDTTLLLWWCDERHPWDAMLELLGAEGPGTFYVDRDGVFHWENRNYRTITERSTTSQATFLDRDDGPASTYADGNPYTDNRLYRDHVSGLWFFGLGYDPGFRNIYNRATYATKRRPEPSSVSVTPVWEYGATLELSANQSRTLFARPADPFVEAVEPVAATDYTVTAGSATVVLTYSSGFVAFIVVTAGPSGATIEGVTSTGLQLRAKSLTIVSETTAENSVDASESIAKFSPIPGAAIPITLSVQGWPEIDPATAEAVCNAWVNRYMVPRPVVMIGLRNADGEHLRQILERMPSDRITLVEANTGLDADVWVNSTQLRISGAAGRVVEAVLGCEICDELSGAIWDVSLWDDPAAVWGV